MTTPTHRRVALRAATLSGALALLLGACGEPTDQPAEQQQGAVTPEQQGERTDSTMLTGDDLGDATQGQAGQQ